MLKLLDEEIFEKLKEVDNTTVIRDTFSNTGIFSPEIFDNKNLSCACGEMQGLFYTGEICPKCNTEVKKEGNGAKISINFKDDPSICLINPAFIRFFQKRNIKLLDYLNPQNIRLDIEGELIEDDDSPSYISFERFYNEFEKVVDEIFEENGLVDEKFKEFVLENKDKFFIRDIYVLPLNLRDAQLNFNGKNSINIDENNSFYIQLASSAKNIKEFHEHLNIRNTIENELYTMQMVYMELNEYIIDSVMGGKSGLFRNNILSNRITFSARAPIILLDDKYKPDQIKISREIFIELYQLKLVNVLSEILESNYLDAWRFLMLNRFDPENENINKSIKRVLEENELTVLLNRNPTLRHNNLILLYVVGVVDAPVIMVSKMILTSVAGDIDGLN